MGRWPIAGVALSVACSASEAPVFLDLAPLTRDLVVLASLDETDRIVETALIEWDAPEPPNARVAVPFGGRLVGAAFDRVMLEARSPRLDSTRLGDLRLEPTSPDALACIEGVVRVDTDYAQILWPDDARAFEWLADEERRVDRNLETDWWTRVSPSVKLTPNRCRGHAAPNLRPFVTAEPLLDAQTSIGGEPNRIGSSNVAEYARFDEKWLLVAYGLVLVLAERDVGYVDAPGRYLFPEPGWRFRSLALGPREGASGARRVVLVATFGATDSELSSSKIIEATLVDETLTAGATLLESDRVVDAVYVLPEDGRLLAYERPGQILVEDTRGGALVQVSELPGIQPEADKRGRFEPSGLPTHPLVLLGSRPNSIYLGSRDHREWENIQAGLSLGLTLRGFASAPEPDGDFTLYAGNTAGHVFERRLSAASWTTLDLRLDPALIEGQCAVPKEGSVCGFGRPKHSWQHFTAFTDEGGRRALLAFSDFCSLAFVIRPDGCTSTFAVEELGSLFRSSDDEIFTARTEDGFVTLVTEKGRFFEIPRAELGVDP